MSYEVSDDRERFDLVRAHRWISTQSYWAEGIPFETFAKACANSLTAGAYAADGAMAAMARVVTDRATFEHPHAFPDGFEAVIVGGSVAWQRGDDRIRRRGRVLRRGEG